MIEQNKGTIDMNPAANERRFDRWSWLTLAIVVGFALLALATTLYILGLPTDGWLIPYNSNPPPPLGSFAGSWPTPLHAGDQVLAVNGIKVAGGEFGPSIHSTAWQAGKSVTYTIQRAGQRLEIPVTLHRLDAAGILRSLWVTIKDTPSEWIWSLIVLLVFLRRPGNPAARLMFLAFVPGNVVTKLVWAATTISHNFAPAPVLFSYHVVNSFWGIFFYPAIILLGLSFPIPVFPLTRWPRGLPILLFGSSLVLSILANALNSDPLAAVILITDAALLILAFGAALLNTRRLAHNPVARAQAVWVAFGFGLTIIPILITYLLSYAQLLDLNRFGPYFNFLFPLVLPICLAIAVTRYHLFDVYVIIRRTLIYSVLTAILALFYFGSVVILQQVFRWITGQGSDLAIIFSTLVIAALFTPLRRRVQILIDQRFYRSKYDAQQVLVSFGDTLREEVDLQRLTSNLLTSVDVTMQPERVSVWMKAEKGRANAKFRGVMK